MKNFWISDGVFTGQAAEDLAAIYEEQAERDYTPEEEPGDWHDDPNGPTQAELYAQEFTDPFGGE